MVFYKMVRDPYRRDIKDIHRPLLHEFDILFKKFDHTLEVKSYGHKRIFPNGLWFDLLCHQAKKPAVLRISRWARLVRQHPMLWLLFTPMGVIAKMNIPTKETIQEKNILGLLQYAFSAPKWIKYND